MRPPDPAAARDAVLGTARKAIARVRPDALVAERPLPIRRPAADVQRLWGDPTTREAILDGIPARDAQLRFGAPDRDWGTPVTLRLELAAPMPGMATRALAGKAVRRLKALAETGEIPTTAHNPSARADAGEPTP